MIRQCLAIGRQKRPTAREILCDSFFQEVDLPNFQQKRKELLLLDGLDQERATSQQSASRRSDPLAGPFAVGRYSTAGGDAIAVRDEQREEA